jgi:hypothetical protein
VRIFFKRLTVIGFVSLCFFRPTPAKADLFGGDVAVLVQILANAFQQLQQLQQLLRTGSDNLALIREINQGINDSLNLIRTISPYTDPGLYSAWNQVQTARKAMEPIYGTVVPSKIATMQEHTDENVAEAITVNNAIYSYTKDIDQIGESIKQYSHSVSPGGAQKLTAEGIGIMLNVMNQSLRAQATGLKLQAQGMAVQNQKDKEYVRHLVDSSQKLNTALKAQDTRFSLPRF